MITRLLKYLTVAMLLVPVVGVAADFNDNTETPGKRISRRGAEVFQVEKFKRVFGAPVVEGWGIDWSILGDADIPVTDPTKRNNLRMLLSKIEQVEQRPEGYANIFLEVHDVSGAMKRVHKSRLSEVVHDYFSDLFPGSTITSQMKMNGVQMGEIFFIEEPNGSKHKFYVKTHSKGTLSSQSTAAKQVYPGELLVYKMMEELGIGCEVHFCARSPEDVYIATRDARDGGVFHLFDQAIKDDEGIGAELWGGLGRLDKSPRSGNGKRIEAELPEDPVATNFVEQTSVLDLITRIMRLCDLLNNPENFGFQKREGHDWTVRPIDFRIRDKKSPEEEGNIFQSFLDGNGVFRYWTAHKSLRFVLYDRSREGRVQTAFQILSEGVFKNFTQILSRANEHVLTFLSQDCFQSCRDDLEGELAEFYATCLENHAALLDGLKKRTNIEYCKY